MDDAKQQLVNDIVTRLSIDKAAAEETIQAVQKYSRQTRELITAETTLESADYHTNLDMRREKLVEHYAALETLIEQNNQKKMEMAKSNAEEEKRVANELSEDLKKLEDKKKEGLEENKKHHELGLKMGQEQMGLMKALGFADFAGFAGALAGPMAALTFLGGSIAQAHSTLRESRIEGTKLAVSMGMEPDAGFAMGQSVLELSRTRGISKEDASSVMRAFSPIASSGQAGAAELRGLAGQALDMSTITGAGAPDIARLMTNFKVLEDVDMKQLANRFMSIDYAAKEAGVTTQSFVGWLNTAIDAGKIYNVSIDESKNLIGRFSTELREGTLTMTQVTAMQTAVAKSPEGFRAFIGGKMAEQGGPVADYFSSIGATSAIGRATALRALGEGMLINEKGEVYKPEEGSDNEKRMMSLRQSAEKAYSGYVTGEAEKRASSPAEMPFWIERFASMFGMKGDTLFQGQEMVGGLGADATRAAYVKFGQEMLEAAKENQSAAIKQLQAARIQEESQSAISKVWTGWSRTVERSYMWTGAAYWSLRGDKEASAAWDEAYEQIGDEGEERGAKAKALRGYEADRARKEAARPSFDINWNPTIKVDIYNNGVLLNAKTRKVATTPVLPGKQ